MNNERVMQFRIGMFVIVAGLVLTMLIVWFGESPTLFRDTRFLVARYEQAPGVKEGIPVRKNGIRIGEVIGIQFDDRPGQPEGVLVTLAIESKYHLRAGAVPRITRGLIGDVWIDMQPGTGTEPLRTSRTPEAALRQIVEGSITPDPSNALAAAAEVFQDARPTLKAIEAAANGLAAITDKAGDVEGLVSSFRAMGEKVGALADQLNEALGENAGELGPTLVNLRKASEAFTATLDPKTQANLKAAAADLASGTARLNQMLNDVAPLAGDLAGGPDHRPTTALGQTFARAGRVVYDVQLLTNTLRDPNGRLNMNGSIQRLLTQPDLANNLNGLATSAGRVLAMAERTLANFNRFAERVANDPSIISRGALSR
jgi:phospholipid/cholesterol/gamma-HCH transport system substrate-binding protein